MMVTRKTHTRAHRSTNTVKCCVVIVLNAMFALGGIGCLDCLLPGELIVSFIVRGNVLDSETGEPLSGIPVSLNAFVDGEKLGFVSSKRSRGVSARSPVALVTDEQGGFAFAVTTGARMSCATPLGPSLPPPPRGDLPDEIEISVLPSSCNRRFLLSIGETTVLRTEPPENSPPVIELNDPIRVSPCEPLP